MKQKSLSQMNEERKNKTVDNDLLNASNTEKFSVIVFKIEALASLSISERGLDM